MHNLFKINPKTSCLYYFRNYKTFNPGINIKYIYGKVIKHTKGIKYGNLSIVVFVIKSFINNIVIKYL